MTNYNFDRNDEYICICPELRYSCSDDGKCIENGTGIYSSLAECIAAINLGNCTNLSTPTPTPTQTHTITPTKTPTPTQTSTPPTSQSPTPTITKTPTETPTLTPTITQTPTLTPTITETPTLTPTPTPTPTQSACPEVLICSGLVADFANNCGLIFELQVEKNSGCCCKLEYSLNGSGVWIPVPTALVDCDASLTYTLNPTCFGDIIP